MDTKQMCELDTWIAEHVTNIKQFVGVKKRGYWYRPDAHGYTDREQEAWHLTREEAKKHEYPRQPSTFFVTDPVTICEFGIPLYTTDPAAAMEVLKKCAEHSDMPIEIDRKRDKKTGQWRVETGVVSQGLVAISPHENNTLELAICLFAKSLFSK
jgi:hypothetical protein